MLIAALLQSPSSRNTSKVPKDLSKGYPSRGLTRDWSQEDTFYEAPKLSGRGKWKSAIAKAEGESVDSIEASLSSAKLCDAFSQLRWRSSTSRSALDS